jgi:1-aminocyclopropane-1-carboxylate deaminase/D-cysteine desulfhydrase-like pyridoxal-dependent ACC family enzyme
MSFGRMLASKCAGVILDPVYSGKAVYHMVQRMQEDLAAYRGKVSCHISVHTKDGHCADAHTVAGAGALPA